MLHRTYAQKSASGTKVLSVSKRQRYKLDSGRKSLIYNGFKLCFFCGHSSQSLDFQGFGEAQDKI